MCVFGFRWPTPEPPTFSPAFGANLSPDKGRAQGQGKAFLWGRAQGHRFRQPLLGPGKGKPDTSLRSPPAFSFSPFLSPSPFPTFLLPASAFFSYPAPALCAGILRAKAADPTRERQRVSSPQLRECVWGIWGRRHCSDEAAPGAAGSV